jgi:hypothetical protein
MAGAKRERESERSRSDSRPKKQLESEMAGKRTHAATGKGRALDRSSSGLDRVSIVKLSQPLVPIDARMSRRSTRSRPSRFRRARLGGIPVTLHSSGPVSVSPLPATANFHQPSTPPTSLVHLGWTRLTSACDCQWASASPSEHNASRDVHPKWSGGGRQRASWARRRKEERRLGAGDSWIERLSLPISSCV